ncbi:hypothetical protein ACI68E_003298 [Malassezia pachydermatis]
MTFSTVQSTRSFRRASSSILESASSAFDGGLPIASSRLISSSLSDSLAALTSSLDTEELSTSSSSLRTPTSSSLTRTRTSSLATSTDTSDGAGLSSSTDTPSSAASPTSSAAPSVSPNDKASDGGGTNTGAIVGGVVGGVVGFLAVVALLGLLFWLWRRKRRNAAKDPYNRPMDYVHNSPSDYDGYGQTVTRSNMSGFDDTAANYAELPASSPIPGAPPVSSGVAGMGTGAAVAGGAAAATRRHSSSNAAPVRAHSTSRAGVQPPTTSTLASTADEMVGIPSAPPPPPRKTSQRRRSPPAPPVGAAGRRHSGGTNQTQSTEYVDVDPTSWPTSDTWVEANDSPYARAGVGHSNDDEPPPPMAFHMRPGQIVSNASPVGAFTESWQNNARSAVPIRTSQAIRDSLR